MIDTKIFREELLKFGLDTTQTDKDLSAAVNAFINDYDERIKELEELQKPKAVSEYKVFTFLTSDEATKTLNEKIKTGWKILSTNPWVLER